MATGVILLIAQAAAAPAAPPATPPDIELTAQVRTREITIAQDGPIVLRLEVEPGVTDVTVQRNQPGGAKSYRNLIIDARVASWLRQDDAGSLELSAEASTGEPPQ